jgi:hypothetical protein
LVFGRGELALQFVLAGAQFGAALVDVADEVLVDTVGEFEVADQALALGLGLGDRPAQGAYPAGALVPGGFARGLQLAARGLELVILRA